MSLAPWNNFRSSSSEGVLPPPGSHPVKDQGLRRIHKYIVGGLFIEEIEARRWFESTYQTTLSGGYGAAKPIVTRLNEVLVDKDIGSHCSHYEYHPMGGTFDIIVITHVQQGPFFCYNPEDIFEVLDEFVKPKPGVHEEKVKEQLKEQLGIETSGYKSFYTDKMYSRSCYIDTRGIRTSIISGPLIEEAEARRWFERIYQTTLPGSSDAANPIVKHLNKFLVDKDISVHGSRYANHAMGGTFDIIVVTHIQLGPFYNENPDDDNGEEVVDDFIKPALPGEKEKKVEVKLKEQLGIETCGYKTFYCNNY